MIMKVRYTYIFKRDFDILPRAIKKQVDKQLVFLFTNFRHPSLHVKKIQGIRDIWEARVSKDYRFTFQKHNNIIILRKVGKHKKILKRP